MWIDAALAVFAGLNLAAMWLLPSWRAVLFLAIALMFVVMTWHARRRVAAMQARLERQRRFLQDASHELSAPITVALGHAELTESDAPRGSVADDARIVTGELARLRRLAGRLLLLLGCAGRPCLRRGWWCASGGLA